MEILSSVLYSVLILPIVMLCFHRRKLPSISTHNQFSPLAQLDSDDDSPSQSQSQSQSQSELPSSTDMISSSEESRNPAAVDQLINRPLLRGFHPQGLCSVLIHASVRFLRRTLPFFSLPTHDHPNVATTGDSIFAIPDSDTPPISAIRNPPSISAISSSDTPPRLADDNEDNKKKKKKKRKNNNNKKKCKEVDDEVNDMISNQDAPTPSSDDDHSNNNKKKKKKRIEDDKVTRTISTSEVSRTPPAAATTAASASNKKWDFDEKPSQVIYPGIKYGYDNSKES